MHVADVCGTYKEPRRKNGQVMNSKPQLWWPEREEADSDDAEDDGSPDAPVVPRHRVVQPDVGVGRVQENLKQIQYS